MTRSKKTPPDAKAADLARETEVGQDEFLTSNQGLRINDDQNSLKAGPRGPTLLEDFLLREKITHFDHERIPERIVHARGSGAHGVFQVYEPLDDLTTAEFLLDPAARTPVFVRFSTVAGSRGSSDLARDVRGFAVKFYTQQGNYDLVGNNMPVFFIQDAIKFPDLIHAVKPEPHHEMPQAASAHDTFWDFISLMPESMHMILWVMSDRALPRSYRMMEGFGIHTFRLINARGKSRFVKFHWKPLLGMHSIAWDEAVRISGADPDFHRRDLWTSIENGDFPEWELGIQVVDEKDEHKFEFDLLDPTKLIPEELLPVRRIGKMTLNRNPDNFFAETEQVAFHPGHLVPGIDFSNDPLLQGRLFSYTDTQLLRLGGPNFHEIPINRPIAPLHNHQRDGHMRQMINRGPVAYEPNSLGGGSPMQAPVAQGGFASYAEKIDAAKVRGRSESFFDHFTQARMFYISQSRPEQNHIINAFRFELGKVTAVPVRQRVVYLLSQVDADLASQVAEGLGLDVPTKVEEPLNRSIPADGSPKAFQPRKANMNVKPSPALSMAQNPGDGTIATRRVAALVADGCDEASLAAVRKVLEGKGAQLLTVAPRLGTLQGSGGKSVPIDYSLLTTPSVVFDAVFVPGGAASVETLADHLDAVRFLNEAYRHCKPIAAHGEAVDLLASTDAAAIVSNEEQALELGVVLERKGSAAKVGQALAGALGQHRFWQREEMFTA